MVQEPQTFIGSSSEGLKWAKAIAFHLGESQISTRLWSLSTFAAGSLTVDALQQEFNESHFAVLVVTPDDVTDKRGQLKIAPRDNVVLEFGMALGALGRDRSFLFVPKNLRDFHIPSDLLGYTLVTYEHDASHDLTQRRQALMAGCEEVAERAQKLGPRVVPLDGGQVDDLLDGLSRHLLNYGDDVREDPKRWAQRVLNTVQERFVSRTEDAYSIWLRPQDGALTRHMSTNLPFNYSDHPWKANEGLAGRVWVNGGCVVVSALQEHPWFERLPGCENQTYFCAGVGAEGGTGGLLAVGSDEGFSEQAGDQGFLTVHSAMLTLALTQTPRSPAPPGAPAQFLGSAWGTVDGVASAALRRARGLRPW